MTTEITGYVTVNEIAELLRVSRSTLYALIQRGEFPAGIKIGHSRRWPVWELKAYLESISGGRECLTLLHQEGGYENEY